MFLCTRPEETEEEKKLMILHKKNQIIKKRILFSQIHYNMDIIFPCILEMYESEQINATNIEAILSDIEVDKSKQNQVYQIMLNKGYDSKSATFSIKCLLKLKDLYDTFDKNMCRRLQNQFIRCSKKWESSFTIFDEYNILNRSVLKF